MQVGRSPTPFSVTRGVVGLIAGPSKALRHLNFRVRFICPLQPVVAATDLRTRPGHESETFTSGPSGTGRPPLLAVRWPVPRVSPLTPQITISFTWQRYSFLYRHRVGWFSRPLSWARGHPDGNPSFVPPFRGFRLAVRFRPIFVSRRADAAVGNLHLLGNCVPLKLEVGLGFSLSQNPRRNADRTSHRFWLIVPQPRRILKHTKNSTQPSSRRLLSSRQA